MTQPPPDASPSRADRSGHSELGPVAIGVAVLDTVRGHLDNPHEVVSVDRLELTGRCLVAALDIGALLALGGSGHIADLAVRTESWSLTVRVDGRARPTVTVDGDPLQVFTAEAITRLNRAVDQGKAAAALDVARAQTCDVRVVVINDPAASGTHWIHGVADLEGLLRSPRWHVAASALAADPRVLVIDDGGDAELTTAGLTIRGPAVTSPIPLRPVLDDSAYRDLRAHDGRTVLPSPAVFAGTRRPEGGWASLAQALTEIARCLTWYWLAADTHFDPTGPVEVAFSGARTVTVVLAPAGDSGGDAHAELALYNWAAGSSDPARAEAVQQAVSLAVAATADLPDAAGPALRTARSLYELSRRTAISEALTAARAAREAIRDAARQAAGTARDTAGKAVERALLQLAATVGIVVSNAADLVGRAPAFLLLVLVAVSSVTCLIIARLVELASAVDAFDAELRDLGQYRDVLSPDDISAVQALDVVHATRSALTRARKATFWIYFGTGTAVLAVGGLLVAVHDTRGATPAPTSAVGSALAPTAPPVSAPHRSLGPVPRSTP